MLVGKPGASTVRGLAGNDRLFGDPAASMRGPSALTEVSSDLISYGRILAVPAFSPDGRRIAFTRGERNPDGTTEEYANVYVRTVPDGDTDRVSSNAAGRNGNAESIGADVSPDGTKVVFASGATNLVGGDTNGLFDIFIKDLPSGAVERVSTTASGGQAVQAICYTIPCGSVAARFSPDGGRVVFHSTASNLVDGDGNGSEDVFVKDLRTGAVTRVSVSAAGGEANGRSRDASFDPAGRRVAFVSSATNLVPGRTKGKQVFLKDLDTGAVTVVSTSSAGVPGNAESLVPAFSPDGRRIAFESAAYNLVPRDTNHGYDYFLKDLETGKTVRISTSATGGQGSGEFAIAEYSVPAAFSPDGTKVAFSIRDDKLVPGFGLYGEVFLKDLRSGAIRVVSTNSDTQRGNWDSGGPAFAPDGLSIAFHGPLLITASESDFVGTIVARLPSGPPGDDVVQGGQGDDRLAGAAGRDILDGGPGDDILWGGDSDDLLRAGSGSDHLDGSEGFDRASFAAAPAAVVASLANDGTGEVTGGASATLTRMEGLAGSPFTDRLACAVPACALEGGPGDDVIVGDRDSKVGQFVEYSSASGPVLVDLSAEHSRNMPGRPRTEGRDRLIGVRSIRGTDFRSGDRLIGDGRSNTIEGLGGADRLTGKAGSDVFAYVDPADSLPSAPDVITDFRRAQHDVIDLAAPAFGKLAWIGARSFSAPGQIRFTVEKTIGVLEVNSLGPSGAEFRVELNDVTSLGPNDLRYRKK